MSRSSVFRADPHMIAPTPPITTYSSRFCSSCSRIARAWSRGGRLGLVTPHEGGRFPLRAQLLGASEPLRWRQVEPLIDQLLVVEIVRNEVESHVVPRSADDPEQRRIEGFWRPRSIRAISDWGFPARSASSRCVSPARRRASLKSAQATMEW
jgi:hypothetical protein